MDAEEKTRCWSELVVVVMLYLSCVTAALGCWAAAAAAAARCASFFYVTSRRRLFIAHFWLTHTRFVYYLSFCNTNMQILYSFLASLHIPIQIVFIRCNQILLNSSCLASIIIKNVLQFNNIRCIVDIRIRISTVYTVISCFAFRHVFFICLLQQPEQHFYSTELLWWSV